MWDINLIIGNNMQYNNNKQNENFNKKTFVQDWNELLQSVKEPFSMSFLELIQNNKDKNHLNRFENAMKETYNELTEEQAMELKSLIGRHSPKSNLQDVELTKINNKSQSKQ